VWRKKSDPSGEGEGQATLKWLKADDRASKTRKYDVTSEVSPPIFSDTAGREKKWGTVNMQLVKETGVDDRIESTRWRRGENLRTGRFTSIAAPGGTKKV